MSKLRKILIKTRRQVFTEVVGNNASLFLGEGYDFSELREYQIGDDIRKIDWIITAKLQKPYVKLFHAERELHAVIAVMCSGSTYFGTHRSKQELMGEIASILAFSAVRNSDLFSCYTFAESLHHFQQPTKRVFGVQKMLEHLLSFNVLGRKADYKTMVETLLQRIKRKSLVFIIGDFFDSVELRVLAKKHEVMLIVVRDRMEENPPSLGFASLMDPESQSVLEGDFGKRSVEHYRKKVIEHDRTLYRHCRENQIIMTKIYTDEDPIRKLLKLFARKGGVV